MIDDRFEWISCREDTPESLKAAYLSERDVTLRSRLHGLWLLRSGRRLSEYQVAWQFTSIDQGNEAEFIEP